MASGRVPKMERTFILGCRPAIISSRALSASHGSKNQTESSVVSLRVDEFLGRKDRSLWLDVHFSVNVAICLVTRSCRDY
ncbi:hypothetical protein PssB301D_03236 [Pseudomonas syringae pv. syringae str. B301D-R]|nr:hypothetical protein PsyrB_05455 [Pseudomonas syringae pv. syringae B301D]EXL30550.1 hypothetical protein PssB301D_03236 [Pseudomonas syringae pv. syringae str. B301D-R]